MKNTTKLRNLLQLYTISLDADEEDNFHLTLIHKTSGAAVSFIEKAYTVAVGKAFSHMIREIKAKEKMVSKH